MRPHIPKNYSAAALGKLTNLREFRVAGNRLVALPEEIGSLRHLRKLVADNNLITAMPGPNSPLLSTPMRPVVIRKPAGRTTTLCCG